MGDYNSVKAEIKNFIYSRTPLILIVSPERERAERMLKEIVIETGVCVHYYTDTKQLCSFGANHQIVDVDNEPLPFISNAFKKNRGMTFSIGDVKRISDDNLFSREILNLIYLAKEMDGTLILITADPVWPRIAQLGMLTELDQPSLSERMAYIKQFIVSCGNRYPIVWDSEDILKAATQLSGFTETQIENILSSTLVKNQGLSRVQLQELRSQKNRLYASVPSIQLVKLSHPVEVSGLHGMKRWLDHKKRVFFSSDETLNLRNLETPKGILLAGVPGCGKSYSAKMISINWELPLYRFDIGSVYDKWVGESEKRMQEALQFIDNVSPCVLWIDEIEKALSISDTGNDTGKRILGQFLFWLQESKSKVFLVATANDVSQLPIELFRKGRFSEVFFLDLPNKSERRAAIGHYSRITLQIEFTDDELNELVSVSDGFSYSDIEYAIKDVAQVVLCEPEVVILHKDVISKFGTIVPISKSNPEVVARIQQWGKVRAVPASVFEEDLG